MTAFQSPSSRVGRCSGYAAGTTSTLSLSMCSTRVKKYVKNNVGIRRFSIFCEMQKFSTGYLIKGRDATTTSSKSMKTRSLSDISLLYGSTPTFKNTWTIFIILKICFDTKEMSLHTYIFLYVCIHTRLCVDTQVYLYSANQPTNLMSAMKGFYGWRFRNWW